MKEEMEELYIEGVAIHDDPESCVDVREDGGEALTGARAGRAIEPRNRYHPGCPRCQFCGRPHRQQRYRELPAGPAWSKNQGMYVTFMCENREVPRPPVWCDRRAGRSGKAQAVTLR
jgi:hypothetical protein